VSSETREYLPTASFEEDVIASDALLTVSGADLVLFGVMSSSAFTAWNRTISGRLKSDMRVSQEITYNNFPWLAVDHPERSAIRIAAEAVLAVRSEFPQATLSDLYKPVGMPPSLVAAHRLLDRAALKAYGVKSGASEADILAALLARYRDLVESRST
jgi:2-oxoglutarate dehydrogenase complex dehydrogenase (E1) component-like enzyme